MSLIFLDVVSVGTFNIIYDVLHLQITRATPGHQWAISLMNADGHFNLPKGYVWVCID